MASPCASGCSPLGDGEGGGRGVGTFGSAVSGGGASPAHAESLSHSVRLEPLLAAESGGCVSALRCVPVCVGSYFVRHCEPFMAFRYSQHSSGVLRRRGDAAPSGAEAAAAHVSGDGGVQDAVSFGSVTRQPCPAIARGAACCFGGRSRLLHIAASSLDGSPSSLRRRATSPASVPCVPSLGLGPHQAAVASTAPSAALGVCAPCVARCTVMACGSVYGACPLLSPPLLSVSPLPSSRAVVFA